MPNQTFFPFIPIAGITNSVGSVEAHQATVLSTSNVFILYVPPTANCVLLQATGQNIRYTLTGTNPTASLGFQMVAGSAPVLVALNDKVSLKFLAEVAGAVLQAEFGHDPVM